MAKITIFYLEHCPYCHHARRAVEALKAENPAYAGIGIDWVEESLRPELAERYDYYYVPTLYDGGRKLYECSPAHGYGEILAHIREAFDAVLG